MTWLDRKIKLMKLLFIIYAFICGQAIYHAYFQPIQPSPVAAKDLLTLSLQELSDLRV